MERENSVAKLLFYTGVVVIIGSIFMGFMTGNIGRSNLAPYGGMFSWMLFINSATRGVVAGIVIIGFSEVVNLLQSIKNSNKRRNEDMQIIRSTIEDSRDK